MSAKGAVGFDRPFADRYKSVCAICISLVDLELVPALLEVCY